MTRLLLVLLFFLSAPGLQAQETHLQPGDSLSGALVTGDTVRYVLETGPDFLVRGTVFQFTVDVVVRILNPEGSAIRTVDGPARGPEGFQFETEEEGRYTLEVIPFQEEEGEYSIVLELMEPLATEPRALADQLLSAYDRDDGPGVAFSVWRDGETLFAKGYGMADLTWGVPFETNTPTNIGSTSKQFTAFAVMLLVEEGKLSLDDDVREHIPELPDLGETVKV